LVLRGEAGIGKTALLEHLIESASDLTVLRSVGMESEMELAYASLHQVCAPLLGRLETLRQPQRQALETVFGLGPGAPPDGFLVGLGVLSLLSEAADERPLLCIVDDAQWLDHASMLTLAFVARRLQADPVGIVFATRELGEDLQHLPALEVRGLVNGDARALLSSAVGFTLDAQVRDRIIAETHGNPLALLELPQGLTATQLAGGFGLVDAHRLPERIEESFVRRITALSDDARRLLLIAAAEPLGDPVLLVRAAERLGIAVSPVEAETDRLLVIGARVAFHHPLVRSAVYRTAAAEERRAAHLALAEATDPAAEPDRRAWHLASATSGPDELVASELERSAERAQARGGLAAGAAFLERAAALTEDPVRRRERALAAAQANLQAGAFNSALALLAMAEAGALDDSQQARAELLRGQVALGSGRVGDAPPLLLNAARRFEDFDIELARETYLTAWGAAIVAACELGGGGVLLEICSAARSLPPPSGNPRPVDLLLDGLARLFTEGHAAATAVLQRAVRALTSITIEDVLRWGWVAAPVAYATWDIEALHAIPARQVQLVREVGALSQLPMYLTQLSAALVWMGDFERAAALIAESDAVATATGSYLPPHNLLWLWGLQGREAEASAAIASATEQAAASGRPVDAQSQIAAAVLHNGLGRYDAAASAAARASSDAFNPWTVMCALPELVEAAARTGDTAVARDALARLVETTRSGTDWALGVEARSRALLSDGEAADNLYRLAIERLGPTDSGPTSPVLICCTGNGCGARIGVSMRVSSSVLPTSSSRLSGWEPLPSARGWNCWRRARRCAGGRSRRAMS
jgi:hypothetical protein